MVSTTGTPRRAGARRSEGEGWGEGVGPGGPPGREPLRAAHLPHRRPRAVRGDVELGVRRRPPGTLLVVVRVVHPEERDLVAVGALERGQVEHVALRPPAPV